MSIETIRAMVLEDEADIREILSTHLSDHGIEVKALENGNHIEDELKAFHPHVILMDQRMPGKSGKEILQIIRANLAFTQIPVIMVSGLGSEAEKVESLSLGADDYVTKPFSMAELVARVHAVVRRAQLAYSSKQKSVVLRDLVIDLTAHQALLGGQPLHLTLTEFRILAELMAQAGEVLTRDRLRERALGNMTVTDRTIDVHMASLRKKLGAMGDAIETIRGVGYKMSKSL